MGSVGETTLEIRLAALAHNYRYFRSQLKEGTKFMAVVKAFAYGSDMAVVAKKLEVLGVDYFAVAYVKEGVLLREAGITTPILVLHPQEANFEALITHRLEPSLYSPRILRAFLATAIAKGQQGYPVHLKFNTGLNRLGFWENDLEFISKTLQGSANLKITGVLSHLAASEDKEEKDFTRRQIDTFAKISNGLTQLLGYQPLRHILNTSGIVNYPEAQLDMVRSGIGLYGYGNQKEVDSKLQPVANLKTIISQLHKIEPGETVGYNRAFTAKGYQITATLPLGHADGIGRHYGHGKTMVLLHGKQVPIIGNVCMDMIMIDVTHVPCKEGDEVLLFGAEHSAEAFADSGNSISYEILTSISQRVRRVVVA